MGDHAGKRVVVCVVHAGRFSSHFKLMEVVDTSDAGTFALQHLRSFYLPDRARSVHIWNKTVGVGLRSGFQCVDPLSLVTFPVPVGPPSPTYEDKKCRAMFRVGERFLLCYDCTPPVLKLGPTAHIGASRLRILHGQSRHFVRGRIHDSVE